MTSKILCLNLILILSVHGHEVVARIRFLSSQHRVSEQSDEICIPVENTAAPASKDFSISFSFDSVLIGFQDGSHVSGSRQGAIRFSAESSTGELCFPHMEDDIACEPDIVGQVRLINSSAVIVTEPSTATVIIEDDDAASIGFKSSSQIYSEGGLSVGDVYPVIQSSHPSLPITIQVSEVQHSSLFVFSSLTINDTLLSVTSLEEAFQLSIHDDDVALEAPEAIILELSVYNQASCSLLNLTPFNQTQITIVDNDAVTVGLERGTITVKESARSVQVCVSLSSRIARHLAFRITTRNGTANSGEDFTGRIFTGQFMPLSDLTRVCYDIAIAFDSIIEQTETFSVDFVIETSLPNEVRERVTVANAVTNIVIEDSSDCYRIVLDGRNNRLAQYFVPKSSTVCFDCIAYEPNEVRGSSLPYVLWLLNSQPLSNDDHFANGHVTSNGTLLVTNSSKSFDLSSITTIGCANNLDDSGNNMQQAIVNFQILLGAPPRAISLVSSEQASSSNSASNLQQQLTCVFEGVPEPQVEWLLNNRPVGGSFSSVESAVLEEPNRYKSVLKLPEDGAKGVPTYTCLCKNHFGEAQMSITFRETAVTGGVASESKAMKVTVGLLFAMLIFVFCLFL